MASEKVSNRSKKVVLGASNDQLKVGTSKWKWSRPNLRSIRSTFITWAQKLVIFWVFRIYEGKNPRQNFRMHFGSGTTLCCTSRLQSYRLKRSIRLFSIGWTFFMMPPTWKTRWCYYLPDICNPSSIPSADGILNFGTVFFYENTRILSQLRGAAHVVRTDFSSCQNWLKRSKME